RHLNHRRAVEVAGPHRDRSLARVSERPIVRIALRGACLHGGSEWKAKHAFQSERPGARGWIGEDVRHQLGGDRLGESPDAKPAAQGNLAAVSPQRAPNRPKRLEDSTSRQPRIGARSLPEGDRAIAEDQPEAVVLGAFAKGLEAGA